MNGSTSSLTELTGLPRDQLFNEIFDRYASRLLRAAETHLHWRLRPKVGVEDVVQSAFKSFYRRMHHFQLGDGDSSDPIWALLVVITIRKCRKWETFFHAEKRNVLCEAELSAEALERAADNQVGNLPEDLVVVSELLARLLSGFDERRQAMIMLRIEGHELDEIAQRCCSSRRTVARTIAEAKTVLTGILECDMKTDVYSVASPCL